MLYWAESRSDGAQYGIIFSQRRQYNVVLPSQNRNSFCIAIQLFLFLKKKRANVRNFGLI